MDAAAVRAGVRAGNGKLTAMGRRPGEDALRRLRRRLSYWKQKLKKQTDALEAQSPRFFAQHRGQFWALPATRDYCHSVCEVGNTLWRMGRNGEALHFFLHLLELSAHDHLGVRFAAVTLLLESDREADARAIMAAYPGVEAPAHGKCGDTHFAYTHALLAVRSVSESQRRSFAERVTTRSTAAMELRHALDLLDHAFRQNGYVARFLAGDAAMPDFHGGFVVRGGEDEAINYVRANTRLWAHTSHAVGVLVAAVDSAASGVVRCDPLLALDNAAHDTAREASDSDDDSADSEFSMSD